MNFQEVNPLELSEITYHAYLSNLDSSDEDRILCISFAGEYKFGSGGSKDCGYILSVSALCRRAYSARYLIIDFSKLNYVWGDGMDNIFSITYNGSIQENAPLAVIVGDGCREGIKTLLEDEYSDVCVESVEQAIDLMREQMKRYEDAMDKHRDVLKEKFRLGEL